MGFSPVSVSNSPVASPVLEPYLSSTQIAAPVPRERYRNRPTPPQKQYTPSFSSQVANHPASKSVAGCGCQGSWATVCILRHNGVVLTAVAPPVPDSGRESQSPSERLPTYPFRPEILPGCYTPLHRSPVRRSLEYYPPRDFQRNPGPNS